MSNVGADETTAMTAKRLVTSAGQGWPGSMSIHPYGQPRERLQRKADRHRENLQARAERNGQHVKGIRK